MSRSQARTTSWFAGSLLFALNATVALADIDHLAPPAVYDNARSTMGQTFVARDPWMRGVVVFLGNPSLPADPLVNALEGPADLVLWDVSDVLHPVEVRREQVLAAGMSASGMVTLTFSSPAPTTRGVKYLVGISTNDYFGLGLRNQTASTYPDGAEGFINCGHPTICYGAYQTGQLIESSERRDLAFEVLGATGAWASVSAGGASTCAVTASGGLWCWGWNVDGMVGDGTTVSRPSPVPVTGIAGGTKAVSVGGYHACGVGYGGGAWCWGRNSGGQVGDGSTTQRLQPTPVSGLSSGVKQVAAGYEHSCAVTSAGVVKCWGANAESQLGDGTTTPRSAPVTVTGLASGYVAVATGTAHSCALSDSGAVRCWGRNASGQLGDGTTLPRSTSVAVAGLGTGVAAISAAGNQSCALTTAGALKCWGENGFGQLGDGTQVDRSTPVNVSGLTSGVAAVEVGAEQACALTSTGAVHCWGHNDFGELGNSGNADSATPVGVTGLGSGVVDLSMGEGLHGCASSADGVTRCWGRNSGGQLGDGSTADRSTPVAVAVSSCSLPTAGLIAHVPLAAGSANDVVAGRVGETSNVTSGPDRVGTPNGAMRFSGTTSWARIPFTGADPLALSSTDQFSAAIWINADSLAARANDYIPFQVGQQSFAYGLNVQGGGRPYAGACTPTEFCQQAFGVAGSVTPATWTHLAMRFDGVAHTLTLLVNGVVTKTNAVSFSDRTADQWLKIGNLFDAGMFYFAGRLSDLRIYDRLLTDSEAIALAGTCPVAPLGSLTATPTSGPLAGGTRVTLAGTAVGGATSVTIGGLASTIATVVDASTIVVISPAVSTSGARDVVVTTPSGVLTLTGGFTYLASETVTDLTTSDTGQPVPNGTFLTQPSLSADGRFVAYVASSDAVITGDTNGVADVVVRDRARGTITRVSVTSNGAQANGPSKRPRISAGGRYVAFWSEASNLVPGDTNGVRDVFVHDRDADGNGVFDESSAGATTTTRVSVASNGAEGNAASASDGEPLVSGVPADAQLDLSPDGLWVAFGSEASNLVEGDTNGVADVFLHGLASGLTTRLSVSADGTQADGASQSPAISAGGRRVAFASTAGNLVAGDNNHLRDVFLVERSTGQVVRLSAPSPGVDADGASDTPSIDDAGRVVAFATLSRNLLPALAPSTTSQIVVAILPAITAGASTTPGVASPLISIPDILRQIASGVLPPGAATVQPGDGASTQPDVCGSGTCLGYATDATNLTPNDPDTNDVRDVLTQTVSVATQAVPATPVRTSKDTAGNEATRRTIAVSVSNDGSVFAMESEAALTPTAAAVNANGVNVFVRGAPLTVSSVSATFARRDVSQPLVFTGAGFQSGATVVFGSTALPALVEQEGRTLTVPTPVGVPVGVVSLAVRNPDGASYTLWQGFTFLDPPDAAPAGDMDNDGLPDAWETLVGLDPHSAAVEQGAGGDPDADGWTNAQEYQRQTHPRGTVTRYLAEGATSRFFTTTLGLANPGTQPLHVWLRFQKSDGTAVPLGVKVPGQSSRTVQVNAIEGLAQAEFATVVESDGPLAVHRTMSWDPVRGYGSHMEGAVPAPSTRWYLAEGSTNVGFQLFYLLQNPGAAAADVEIRYLLPAGAPVVRTYTVPAGARFNVWANTEPALAATDVSAVVTSTNGVPIIVERAMYLDAGGQTFGAGHESAGVTSPATRWFLAEGATGSYFDLFLLLANPGATPATVTATYLLPSGATVTKTYVVEGQRRFTIWVDQEDAQLADTAVSTTLVSDVPILAERAMWWPGGYATWIEAHNSFGATTTGTVWALGGGAVSGPPSSADTYVLVANTAAAPATVAVTVLFEDGTAAVTKSFTVAATSRFNVDVAAEFPEAMGKRFGVVVESVAANGQPAAQIVVETASYHNDSDGRVWAAGANALATRMR